MKRVGFVYDEIFLKHEMPDGHPESPKRLIAILETLKVSEYWNQLIHMKPRRASDEDILAVHTRDYLNTIRSFTGFFDGDTYLSEYSFEAAMFAAGAVIEAIDRCKRKPGFYTPGGGKLSCAGCGTVALISGAVFWLIVRINAPFAILTAASVWGEGLFFDRFEI